MICPRIFFRPKTNITQSATANPIIYNTILWGKIRSLSRPFPVITVEAPPPVFKKLGRRWTQRKSKENSSDLRSCSWALLKAETSFFKTAHFKLSLTNTLSSVKPLNFISKFVSQSRSDRHCKLCNLVWMVDNRTDRKTDNECSD